MRKHICRLTVLSLTGWLAVIPLVHADDSTFDIDPKFRAKIEKEKVKQAYLQRQAQDAGQGDSSSSATCGSQSIGNVNTGGGVGSSPREVFVFAPNAINLVSGSGCH